MRTIATVNQKGGSGKTTTAVNLAAALAERQRRVLVIDLDPQASASGWLGAAGNGRGMLDVFLGHRAIGDMVSDSVVAGVEVVGASEWLVGAEKALAGEVGAEALLRRQLETVPAGRWDYILVDCPPALGVLTVNALVAVREVLIPVEAHVMALSGLAQLMETIGVVRERLNPGLMVAGIVLCRVDLRTRHAREVGEEVRKRFAALTYNTIIRENIRIAECPSFRQPIIQYDPKSAGAADYRALAEEVVQQERSE